MKNKYLISKAKYVRYEIKMTLLIDEETIYNIVGIKTLQLIEERLMAKSPQSYLILCEIWPFH